MAIAVENLKKIYKEKGGEDVRALKGISFNLPDKGMVFILGKSGCGKSTLLNILGGLDGFDSGDIIVDGQSIKGYTARQSDKYRNDYVGFVFQESNLLEKESIKRNVGLALDLQSLKDTDGKIASALESVGLKDLADQKCNCISGGQKQRVAIARALIKQPKLLLCDEPTGALDSETGEEIFTLLKELSRERLVVVVSHDRESAEKYGDRVIELKDGEIISDSAPQEKTEGVAQEIKKHGGLRFVRAFRLGAGYIIARPVRMAICLLLCLITFAGLGSIDSIYSYDRDKAILYTMNELDSKCYAFGKAFNHNNNKFVLSLPEMTLEEADELSGLLDVDRCDYVYGFHRYQKLLGLNIETAKNVAINKFCFVAGYVEADESFLNDYGFEMVTGALPENNDEVVLPLYLFNFFKTHGYKDGAEVVPINSYSDLIGKTVIASGSYLNLPPLTVTGIIDTNFVYDKQADVLFNGAPIYGDKSGLDFDLDMDAVKMDVIHNMLFVCNGYNDYFIENINNDRQENYIVRVLAPYNGSSARKLKNIRVYTTTYNGQPISSDDGVCYHVVNYTGKRIWDAEDTFKRIKDYSAYVVAVTVAVTVLFMFYYASGTVKDKRKEIGIFRALGASRLDIAKIYASEHGTFTACAVAVSSAISAILVSVVNNIYTKSNGISTVFIKFGIRQFGVIASVAILAVAVGVAIPLIKLLIKRPVDVIADRK